MPSLITEVVPDENTDLGGICSMVSDCDGAGRRCARCRWPCRWRADPLRTAEDSDWICAESEVPPDDEPAGVVLVAAFVVAVELVDAERARAAARAQHGTDQCEANEAGSTECDAPGAKGVSGGGVDAHGGAPVLRRIRGHVPGSRRRRSARRGRRSRRPNPDGGARRRTRRLGLLVGGDPLPAVLDDLLGRGRLALGQHHHGRDVLAPGAVGHADHGGVGHRGMALEAGLDLGRVDVLGRRLDEPRLRGRRR